MLKASRVSDPNLHRSSCHHDSDGKTADFLLAKKVSAHFQGNILIIYGIVIHYILGKIIFCFLFLFFPKIMIVYGDSSGLNP
mmetsp:Transcript_16044/g.21201  ORF Transcript_16044/g.21201 Transcript_16044/m.21201 type:complete len:82 (+) Transcript_16044:255-500(+)